ncbi:Kelch repeat-containing protein [Corallococcus llansteffanensis]|uniref:PKD domain-containing protein n=1 Tax=Corallococcus llansteffanensis TaxID=2316731 RepID=A0A3A8N9D4_9BACT|nr:kelch motif-containing protein [Corallococcus llansteffanensis]RKH41037.1 PKD domain-containing protein [Corallococcus llansteffanensis]
MQRQDSASRALVCLVLAAVALAGCGTSGTEPLETGNVTFMGSVPQALAGDDVARVTVTLTASGVPTSTTVLALTDGAWSGTLYQVPVGTNRTFTAEAFGADGSLRYRGQATGVAITSGATAVVAITLQSLQTGGTFDNTTPIIDSLVASASTVLPGGTLSLQATAHDPDPSDTITYAWTATDGTFGSAGAGATTWKAPATGGTFALTLTVTDSRGAAATLRVDVTVVSTDGGAGSGAAAVSVSFNTSPSVQRITASRSPVPVGQGTVVTAQASDGDGDTLTYQWTASCAGSWTQATSSAATFTPSAVPTGDACGSCALNVTVKDPKGGQTQGTLRVCVGPSTGASVPPRIVLANQSATSVNGGGTVTFRVLAEDGDGSALTFAWAASTGTLGTATSGFTSSENSWKAPACAPVGAAPSITATVINARGFSASTNFSVAVLGAPDCVPENVGQWEGTGNLVTPRYGASALTLPSGKVLLVGGSTGSTGFTSAELYSSDTASWTSAGNMSVARVQPGMTVLPSGKVLVTGGWTASNSTVPQKTVELHDPTTNTWTATPSMAFARAAHTATLLPSGKVLVVGGNYGGDATSTRIPELFDPATNTWTPMASSAPGNRSGHAAVLLPSGKLLVVGGGESAEFYDPGANTWAPATGVTGTSWTHAFLLPSGKVLMVAGQLIAVYDPALNVQSSVGAFTHARTYASLVQLPSGKLLVTGGTASISLTAEIFDPATGKTAFTTSMPTSRYHMAATVLASGKVLFAAGYDRDRGVYLNAALLYTP